MWPFKIKNRSIAVTLNVRRQVKNEVNIHPTKEPNLDSANLAKPCKEVSGTALDTQRRCTQEY